MPLLRILEQNYPNHKTPRNPGKKGHFQAKQGEIKQ